MPVNPETMPDFSSEFPTKRMPDEPPDEILAELSKSDPDAFGIIYQRHVRPIYAYIHIRTGNVQDAEDLTTNTFYQALANIPRYKVGNSPFAAWLFRIAHNLTVNHHRDNSRRRTVPLEGALDRNVEYDLIGGIIKDEEGDEVRRAISRLPCDRQQLLVLKFVEELPNATIARYMGRTEGSVKALLHRTVVSLRNNLTLSCSPRPTQNLLPENLH